MDDSTKRFLSNQLMWLGIYFGIAMVITILLPFPFSLIAVIGIIITISMYRRRNMLRRTGQSQGSFFGGMSGGSKGVEYYCMNCGTKHNRSSCPNCGSKMKRVGF